MALAVSGLSPVIITVRMPMSRSSANRSTMPSLTVSFRWMTPRTRGPSATTRGVPPPAAMRSMLSEGHRRKGRGTDVVVGFVECHGRRLTEDMIDGLEVIPRKGSSTAAAILRRWTSTRC